MEKDMTYRVWLLRTYGNSGSAVLVRATNKNTAKEEALKLGYSGSQIDVIEYLGK